MGIVNVTVGKAVGIRQPPAVRKRRQKTRPLAIAPPADIATGSAKDRYGLQCGLRSL